LEKGVNEKEIKEIEKRWQKNGRDLKGLQLDFLCSSSVNNFKKYIVIIIVC